MFPMKLPLLFSSLASALALMFLTGCETVSSTRQYYRNYSSVAYPKKSADTPMPLLESRPIRPHEVIGRLKFDSQESEAFMYRAVEYNARQAGADAAVIVELRRTEHPWERWVPPSTTYTPVTTTLSQQSRPVDRRAPSPGFSLPGEDRSGAAPMARVCRKDDKEDKKEREEKKKKERKKDRDDDREKKRRRDRRHDHDCDSGVDYVTTWVPEYHPGYMEHGVAVRYWVDALMIRYTGR
jgi:hypothetical protein